MIYNSIDRLATSTMYTGYMQSIAHPVWVIWKATLSFVKKHVSYTWIVSSSSAMLGGQKRGVRPNPLEPPLCTGLHQESNAKLVPGKEVNIELDVTAIVSATK